MICVLRAALELRDHSFPVRGERCEAARDECRTRQFSARSERSELLPEEEDRALVVAFRTMNVDWGDAEALVFPEAFRVCDPVFSRLFLIWQSSV